MCCSRESYVAEVLKHFSANVRIYRKKRGFTQAELAGKAGLNRTVLIQIEKGRNVTIRTIAALADALDVSPSALVAAKTAG